MSDDRVLHVSAKRRALGAFGAFSAAVASLLIMGGDASGAADCRSFEYCLYSDSGFAGAEVNGFAGTRDLGSRSNQANSVINNTDVCLWLFDGVNFQGDSVQVRPGARVDELGPMNNRISSIQVRPANCIENPI
ncbi:hypothetical protein GCM10011609_86870 [Lentzea pudingi]|uniref:Peptidase inhibitor family I36 n=1 Tax=Lentzea pudingi TaxID=1789439 RepID=A0ABQ2IVP6_9PSEU|nr:peptidase inhibitor family I36 protein [Lentzea pudingi]GGN29656.1 hypothetical protein GCM10011609_86870 [Lentzea pudingi]